MIQKTICINDVLDGGVPCSPYELQWIIPNDSCIASPCDGCTTDCIDVVVPDGCDTADLQVVVTCPSCGACEPTIVPITICTTEGDCNDCQDCEDSVCVDKCPNFCDEFGVCVDCLEDSACVGDKKCIQGGCQCPPGTTDIGGGICRECISDGDCDACEICDNDHCVPKQCYGKPCIEGNCVDCVNSGHCGPNEVCNENNECDCAQGFERDFSSQQCVPKPDCEDPSECPDCYNCVFGGCQPKTCPEGFACYQDECVPKCNPLNPSCDGENTTCTDIGYGVSVCLPCEEECPEEENPATGTDPDPSNPSNPGTDCSLNGDCPGGFKCENGACVPCDGPCPDGSGGEYENCVENFEINKDDMGCQIEGLLETTQGCSCSILTWSTEVYQRNSNKVSFRVRLRKGNAYESGLNNIPLLGNTGIDNELPISGAVKLKITEYGSYATDPNSTWTNVRTDTNLDFTNLDTVITQDIAVKEIGYVCLDPMSGEQVTVNRVKVEFTLQNNQIETPNGCIYGIQESKIVYVVNESGGNGYYSDNEFFETSLPLVQYDTVQSSKNRTPVFNWYRLLSPSETGGTLIRQAYATKITDFKFRDAWLGISDGFEIQKYYRLESDCSCTDSAFFECDGQAAKLHYCNPDITSLNYSLTNCNKSIILSSNNFTICAANADYPQSYDLYLNEVYKDSFVPVGNTLSINGSYSSVDPIQTITIKLSGIDCEECYEDIEIPVGTVEATVDSYNCDTDELSVSISGGSGNYSIEIDGTPWTPPATVDLVSGIHTITVTDNITDCVFEDDFEVDCCALFALTAPDPNVCGASMTTYDFSVSGGSADYVWEVYDEEGGSLIDSGTSTLENITADLTGYSGASFFVEVTDNKGCIVEKTVFVNYVPGVDVSINNVDFCTGDVTHEIEVTRISGLLPFAYDLKQGGVSQQTGTLTTNTDYIDITLTGNVNFNLELTDSNGCFASKAVTLNEISCPDPIISADDETVCEGEDLIINATISSGTPPYNWTISGDATDSGSGATVASNQGVQAVGTYNYTIAVTDSKGKTDSVPVQYEVLDSSDPECVVCGPEPTVLLSSDVGWSVEPNDPVEVTHDYVGAVSQQWYVDSVPVGTNASLFPDTSVEGVFDIYAEVEYEAGCFVDSEHQNLTVAVPCACTAGIQLDSGWDTDNGATITSNTTSGTSGCTGTAIQATAVGTSCTAPISWSWSLYKNGGLVTTGNTNVFNYTIIDAGTYELRLYGQDNAGCFTPTVIFTKTFVVCRTCDITSDPISNQTICDGDTVNATLHTHNKWSSSNLIRRVYVDEALYSGPTTETCSGSTDCSTSFSVSGLAVGNRTIRVRGTESDDAGCYTEEEFTVTVLPISDPSCQDCGDNSANITITGATCIFGNCWIDAIEDQSVNLSGSATGSPGNFTYQWKTTGGTNVGSGSNVTVGPFDYGDDTTYVLHATDMEGCTFTRSVEVRPGADCSGGITQSFTATSGCQGDPITMSWNITNRAHYEEYTVSVRRASSSSGPYSVVFTGDWNDVYNFTVANSDRWYYVQIQRHECQTQRPPQKITTDPCVDCTGVVSSISSSEGTAVCSIEPTDLTANISGDTAGWTYTWREGTTAGGSVLGTGTTLNNFEAGTFPRTISVWYTKTGCTTGSKSITFTQASGCCPAPTPTISTSCSSGLSVTVNNISTQDRVRFNGGSWLTGTTSRTFVIFGSGGYGVSNDTIEVSREFCDDPYIFNLTSAR